MIGIWFFCLFSLLNSMIFYGKELLQNGVRSFGKRKQSGREEPVDGKANSLWACLCGVAVLVLSAVFLHTDMSAEKFFSAYICVICPVMLLLPVFVFLIGRGGRK